MVNRLLGASIVEPGRMVGDRWATVRCRCRFDGRPNRPNHPTHPTTTTKTYPSLPNIPPPQPPSRLSLTTLRLSPVVSKGVINNPSFQIPRSGQPPHAKCKTVLKDLWITASDRVLQKTPAELRRPPACGNSYGAHDSTLETSLVLCPNPPRRTKDQRLKPGRANSTAAKFTTLPLTVPDNARRPSWKPPTWPKC